MMEPFSIEAAKNGAKVIARDGTEVEIKYYDGRMPAYPIVGYYGDEFSVRTWKENGKYVASEDSNFDLFIKSSEGVTEFEQAVRDLMIKVEREGCENLSSFAESVYLLEIARKEFSDKTVKYNGHCQNF